MPPRNYVVMLPDDIRIQLFKRLVDSNFSDYEGHSDWLESVGHSISRSGIHRYCQESEYEIRRLVNELGTSPEEKEKDKFFIDIRMRCLEVSSGFAEADFDQLFKKGEVVLNWVKLA